MYGSHSITQTADCCPSWFPYPHAWWKNPADKDEDRARHSPRKKRVEKFPGETRLQTVPEFRQWPKIHFSPLEKHAGCEYLGRMVLHSAPWCSGLALRFIWTFQVGCWGWGSCKRQRQWGKWTPFQEEKTLSSSNLGLCFLGQTMTRWR